MGLGKKQKAGGAQDPTNGKQNMNTLITSHAGSITQLLIANTKSGMYTMASMPAMVTRVTCTSKRAEKQDITAYEH